MALALIKLPSRGTPWLLFSRNQSKTAVSTSEYMAVRHFLNWGFDFLKFFLMSSLFFHIVLTVPLKKYRIQNGAQSELIMQNNRLSLIYSVQFHISQRQFHGSCPAQCHL